MSVSTVVTGANSLQPPARLYHFTSAEAHAAIVQSGVINVGHRNLYGQGVYATRYNNRAVALLNGVPPSSSTHVIIINNTEGFVRRGLIPGTFRTQGVPYRIVP